MPKHVRSSLISQLFAGNLQEHIVQGRKFAVDTSDMNALVVNRGEDTGQTVMTTLGRQDQIIVLRGSRLR
jgi:hypothetical protein